MSNNFIDGAISLEEEFGERFRGWCVKKTPLRKESIPLNYKDFNLSYSISICDYNFKFIMPESIEFKNGIIKYTESERKFGVFRFPQNDEGEFMSPKPIEKIQEDILKMTEEEMLQIIKKRKVLVFEAFRVPQYGFEYFNMSDTDFLEIKKLTDESYVSEIKSTYEFNLCEKKLEVIDKIKSTPNNLFILEKVLDKYWDDYKEVSIMSNNIIHI